MGLSELQREKTDRQVSAVAAVWVDSGRLWFKSQLCHMKSELSSSLLYKWETGEVNSLSQSLKASQWQSLRDPLQSLYNL